MAFDFREPSVWISSPPDLQPPLDADAHADVIVVGGGFTGLSTALKLREVGVDVLLLEMDYCGMGASGRNAGHLTPTIGKDLPTLVAQVGKARAGELAAFAERAVRHTESVFDRYSIACDYQPVGNIVAGVHPRHRQPLERSAELAASIGINSTFLTEADMRRRGLPAVFKFGVLEGSGGHLHPGKYVQGLRRAALQAGVRIYEQSRVDRIDTSGAKVRVIAGRHTAMADKVVLATNAYTSATLKRMRSKTLPLRDTLFWTKPLTDRQLAALNWSGREGVYTAHESLENYRITADGRLLGGSKWVHYGFGGALVDGDRPEVFMRWAALLKERFPEAPDLEIETFWGGWISMTPDFLPLSFADPDRKLFYGMGYNGHGLAQATYNGAMLSDQVLNRPNAEVDLLRRRTLTLPPEPMLWLAFNGLMRVLARTDQKVDADLRAARRTRLSADRRTP